MSKDLARQRRELASIRADFVHTGQTDRAIHPDLLSSWRRCARQERALAPCDSSQESASQIWDESPVRHLASDLVTHLGDLAKDENYIAAITDPNGQILWAEAAPEMLRAADRANFMPGSNWSEGAAGTNAPGLSLSLDRPSTVFSVEHWCEPVHDWVCYAAPIHDGHGNIVGCIDLSSTWTRATSMAESAVRTIAKLIDLELRSFQPQTTPRVTLKLLGKARVHIDGRERPMSPRQIEILAVLALCPDGLSLAELRSRVYGDRKISSSTIKAEVSQLRSTLGGAIDSRPYRLTIPVDVDVLDVYRTTRDGDLANATSTYIDYLYPRSESPFLIDERHTLDVTLRTALLQSGDATELLRFAKVNPYDRHIVEVAAARLQKAGLTHPDLHAAVLRLDN